MLSSNDIEYVLALNSLLETNGGLRKINLANLMKYKKPSITSKIHALCEMNILEQNHTTHELGYTPLGLMISESIGFQFKKISFALMNRFGCRQEIANQLAKCIVTQNDDITLEDLLR